MAATNNRFNPALESLEAREVPTTARLSGGLLFVNGTQENDVIAIRQINSVIRISGVAQTYSASRVAGIVVNGLAGDDTVVLYNPALQSGVQHITRPSLLLGGDGNDHISAGSGIDAVVGGAGNDRIWGTWGNDLLLGGSGNDEIYAGDGYDRIYGQGGSDTLFGGAANDYLDGGTGSDLLDGEVGADILFGGADYEADLFWNPMSNDLMAQNYGEDYWYSPSYQNSYNLQQSSLTIPSTSYTNPNKGLISTLLSPLQGTAADFVYRDYTKGLLVNYFGTSA